MFTFPSAVLKCVPNDTFGCNKSAGPHPKRGASLSKNMFLGGAALTDRQHGNFNLYIFVSGRRSAFKHYLEMGGLGVYLEGRQNRKWGLLLYAGSSFRERLFEGWSTLALSWYILLGELLCGLISGSISGLKSVSLCSCKPSSRILISWMWHCEARRSWVWCPDWVGLCCVDLADSPHVCVQ